jgi:hypothetical protein
MHAGEPAPTGPAVRDDLDPVVRHEATEFLGVGEAVSTFGYVVYSGDGRLGAAWAAPVCTGGASVKDPRCA